MKREIIVRTEVWKRGNTYVLKAVTRDSNGRIVGATNQTQEYSVQMGFDIVGRK